MSQVTAFYRYCLTCLILLSFTHAASTQVIDLELEVNVSPPTYTLYGTNVGVITLRNEGNTVATNIQVKIPFPTGLVYSTHATAQGRFEPFGGIWEIATLAGGQTTTLEVTYFVTRDLPSITLFGQVTAVDQWDSDSTPNNAIGTTANEDDESMVQLFPEGQTGGSGQVTFDHFPSNRQLYPRNRQTNQATINIGGEVTSDTYEKIRLKIYRQNNLLNTLDRDLIFTNGTADFDFSLQLTAERVNYRLEAYAVVGRSEILLSSANEVVAGDVIIINGQSNAEARAAAYPTDHDDFLRSYTDNTGWELMNRSFPGQWGARLGKAITTEQGIPVAIFNQAVGAQQIPFYQKDDNNPLAGNYGKLLQRLRDAGVNKNIMAAFWFHGEADGWTTSIADYKQHFTDIYDDWIADYQVQHVYLYQIRFNSCSHPFPRIMEAHRQLGAELPLAETMSTMNSAHDGCHYDYFDGYQVLGDRMYELVKRDFYGGNGIDASSPDVRQIIKSGPRELTIELDDATSGLVATGDPWLDFKLEGSGVQITGGTVLQNKIILQLNGDPAGATGLSYLGHSGPTPSWITLANGVGILTFYNYPICFSCSDPGNTPSADLSLKLTANKNSLANGESIRYTLEVQNSGPDQASAIQVQFVLPSNLIFQNSNGNYDPVSGIWTIGTLDNTEAAKIDINAVANILNPQEFHFAEIISTSIADPDSEPNNAATQIVREDDEASLTLTANPTGGGGSGGGNPNEADLSISMEVVPTQLQVYDFIYFTVRVQNEGPATATNIIVSNPLPTTTVFTSANTSQGNYSPWRGDWQIDRLEAGESANLELQLYVLSDATPVINSAQVKAVDQVDPDSTPNNAGTNPTEDDEAMITVDKNGSSGGSGGGSGGNNGGGGPPTGPDLALSLTTDSDEYQQYNFKTFTLTTSNTGSTSMESIVVRFDYPADFVFTQATSAQGSFEPWLREWSIGDLAAGESVTLELQLYSLAPSGSRKAYAEIIAANPDDIDSSPGNGNGLAANEDDEAIVNLENSADIRSLQRHQQLVTAQKPLHLTKLYPNPVQYDLTLQIESWQTQSISIQLFDGSGRWLRAYPLQVDKGTNRRRIELQDLPAGTYYLHLEEANRRGQRVRFVKIKY